MTRSGIIFSANENLFGKLNEVSYGNTVLREIGVNTIALCYESIKMMYSSWNEMSASSCKRRCKFRLRGKTFFVLGTVLPWYGVWWLIVVSSKALSMCSLSTPWIWMEFINSAVKFLADWCTYYYCYYSFGRHPQATSICYVHSAPTET